MFSTFFKMCCMSFLLLALSFLWGQKSPKSLSQRTVGRSWQKQWETEGKKLWSHAMSLWSCLMYPHVMLLDMPGHACLVAFGDHLAFLFHMAFKSFRIFQKLRKSMGLPNATPAIWGQSHGHLGTQFSGMGTVIIWSTNLITSGGPGALS